MISSYLKPINILCVICYLAFMSLAFDSRAVDALVLYVTEKNGKPIYTSGEIKLQEISSSQTDSPLVAIQYRTEKTSHVIEDLASGDNNGQSFQSEKSSESQTAKLATIPEPAITKKVAASTINSITAKKSDEKNTKAVESNQSTAPVAIKSLKKPHNHSSEDSQTSALAYIEAVKTRKWEYASLLDRYIVRYDPDTYIVLTLRPALQKILEDAFKSSSTRIGAGIIKDPATGEILAMTSSHRDQILSVTDNLFKKDNWSLKATFPVASIYKIIAAAAGIDSGKLTANSSFLAYGKKSYMKVWKAFATSHNGVFGRMARKTGIDILNKYSEAFGFNKNFFFDLDVGKSLARLPANKIKMGQAAAGLNRDFLVSPVHVASIVSTVLNRGKTMKPYLVDYVVQKGKVVFRRRPFQIAQPIKESTARDLYKMMYATTAVGTGKKGFGGFKDCPDLAKICGGKTGTLTGASPNYLFTWFGGFTKATGRDLCIVTLSGQRNHSGIKAASIAGKISHQLYSRRNGGNKSRPVARRQ